MDPKYIRVSEEVKEALKQHRAVVGLETTIISHGMPYPANFETALEVENIIRAKGAVPATIGIVEGIPQCGFSKDELEKFATSKGIKKATERDISIMRAKGFTAATTVGASLAIASALGINVFVTGGIGGVAPNAGETFDISADLPAIVQYPCLVVCSGTKAFMDIQATLEYFETYRVPVVGYQTDEFPFFYSRASGIKLDWSVQNAGEMADIFRSKQELDCKGGIFLGVPLPENEALPAEETRRVVGIALEKIRAEGITGKSLTPALLETIKNETKGKSLIANIALIKNNAAVGAEVAVAISEKG